MSVKMMNPPGLFEPARDDAVVDVADGLMPQAVISVVTSYFSPVGAGSDDSSTAVARDARASRPERTVGFGAQRLDRHDRSCR